MAGINPTAQDPADSRLTATNDGLAADITLISGEPNLRIEIHDVFISSSENTGIVELNEETSNDLIFKFYLTAQSKGDSGLIHLDLLENKDLKLTCPANTFVSVTYNMEAV